MLLFGQDSVCDMGLPYREWEETVPQGEEQPHEALWDITPTPSSFHDGSVSVRPPGAGISVASAVSL